MSTFFIYFLIISNLFSSSSRVSPTLFPLVKILSSSFPKHFWHACQTHPFTSIALSSASIYPSTLYFPATTCSPPSECAVLIGIPLVSSYHCKYFRASSL
ncbi:unnamed protein product [Meloidogyne enterolobii]|uniref:Uncharacterized protein n=1 Tax=Meloidogyne enterolobii TaxID=390850 RepID=A0ACB1AB56_MELEN